MDVTRKSVVHERPAWRLHKLRNAYCLLRTMGWWSHSSHARSRVVASRLADTALWQAHASWFRTSTTVIAPFPSYLSMATRRSKRIKVKAEENPPVAKAATEDSDSEPEYEEKRAVRAKAKPVARGRAVRGKRGSLADMPGMPLDIIFEVSWSYSRHLNPT